MSKTAHRAPKRRPLIEHLRPVLARLVQKDGQGAIAERLELSLQTLASLAAGFPVHRRIVEAVEQQLAGLAPATLSPTTDEVE